jgi:DNA polymerase-3 subunit gamma/tau
VYLFSGQKGCGKTSTARVFAAAINCAQLSQFQKDPKKAIIPCLECDSCRALIAGRHPDFIEIDAASNTGVDNVRQIIDSSALLPLMGRKKIYLIDEAHMLSKAAFNAFLKLMEEPPASVIFILATTDTQKIIETVRSRCFQLFFRPVEETPLLAHLQNVCTSEQIACDTEALQLIIKETDGSIRDALNLLEQVRFSGDRVTKDAVYQVLGHLDDQRLLQLFEIVLYKSPHDFLQFSQENMLEKFSAEFVWQRITELLRACIWIKNGVAPRHFSEYVAQLQFLARGKSLPYLSSLLELFYSNEAMFRKTTAQYAFLEVILLRICRKNESNSNSSTPAMAVSTASDGDELEVLEEGEDSEDVEEEDVDPSYDSENEALWGKLVEKIEVLHDPLLSSIFKQGSLTVYDTEKGILNLEFPKELTFFSDIIESTKAQWQPLFEADLGKKAEIVAVFIKVTAAPLQPHSPVAKAQSDPKPVQSRNSTAQEQAQALPKYKQQSSYNYRTNRTIVNNEPRIDVSDASVWPQAHLLLKYFPGTFTQIREQV